MKLKNKEAVETRIQSLGFAFTRKTAPRILAKVNCMQDRFVQMYFECIPTQSFQKLSGESFRLLFILINEIAFDSNRVFFDDMSLEDLYKAYGYDDETFSAVMDELYSGGFVIQDTNPTCITLNPRFFWNGYKQTRDDVINGIIQQDIDGEDQFRRFTK